MEPTEAIPEGPEARDRAGREEAKRERFRTRGALQIAMLAMALAVNSLGGEHATEQMIHGNMQANTAWSAFHALTARQSALELAADRMEADLLLHPAGLSPEARGKLQGWIARYRAASRRAEDDPDPRDRHDPLLGEGKKQLVARARFWEAVREHAEAQDPSFDLAGVLFEIGIVLGSVAVLTLSAPLLVLSAAAGLIAAVLMLNGYFLWFVLPL